MRLPKLPIRHAILEQRGLNGIVRTTYFRIENGVNRISRITYSCDEKTQDSSSKFCKNSPSLKICDDSEGELLHGIVYHHVKGMEVRSQDHGFIIEDT